MHFCLSQYQKWGPRDSEETSNTHSELGFKFCTYYEIKNVNKTNDLDISESRRCKVCKSYIAEHNKQLLREIRGIDRWQWCNSNCFSNFPKFISSWRFYSEVPCCQIVSYNFSSNPKKNTGFMIVALSIRKNFYIYIIWKELKLYFFGF